MILCGGDGKSPVSAANVNQAASSPQRQESEYGFHIVLCLVAAPVARVMRPTIPQNRIID